MLRRFKMVMVGGGLCKFASEVAGIRRLAVGVYNLPHNLIVVGGKRQAVRLSRPKNDTAVSTNCAEPTILSLSRRQFANPSPSVPCVWLNTSRKLFKWIDWQRQLRDKPAARPVKEAKAAAASLGRSGRDR